jgi:hypothetical protein
MPAYGEETDVIAERAEKLLSVVDKAGEVDAVAEKVELAMQLAPLVDTPSGLESREQGTGSVLPAPHEGGAG